MDKAEEVRQWLFLADEDLMAVEVLFKHHPRPDEVICFHCQQSAEKYLKGFLVERNTTPPAIHDLIELLERCKQILPEFDALNLPCSFLNQYSVIPRYPKELPMSPGDVESAVKYAVKVKTFVETLREKPNGTITKVG